MPNVQSSSSTFISSSNDAPIFIIACCQRSGSTLLQRLLNSHPEILIWGEHGGYINHLYDGFLAVHKWKQQHGESGEEFLLRSDKVFMPNSLADSSCIDRAFQEHVRAMFPVPLSRGSSCAWGFKEVRYTIWTALFLEKLFPRARFIHLVRNIDSCLTSMRRLERERKWEAEWTAEALSNWVKIGQSFSEYSRLLQNRLLVRYEDLLGKRGSETSDAIESFLGLRHGSLNTNVLKVHVDFVAKGSHRVNLSDEDVTLLHQPDIMALKAHFGYT